MYSPSPSDFHHIYSSVSPSESKEQDCFSSPHEIPVTIA